MIVLARRAATLYRGGLGQRVGRVAAIETTSAPGCVSLGALRGAWLVLWCGLDQTVGTTGAFGTLTICLLTSASTLSTTVKFLDRSPEVRSEPAGQMKKLSLGVCVKELTAVPNPVRFQPVTLLALAFQISAALTGAVSSEARC